MVRIDLRGASYHVCAWGEIPKRPTESPVLLLHGFTGSGNDWEGVAQALFLGERDGAPFDTTAKDQTANPALGHRPCVMALDALGHGESDSPDEPDRYAVAHVVEDIHDVLRCLGVESVHLVGYSMGGRTALAFTVEKPGRVRSLVLESASPGLRTAEERQIRRRSDAELADFIEREGTGAFTDRWEALPLFASQARLPERTRYQVRAQRLRNNPRGMANSLRGMGTGSQESYWERLGGIACPVLIVTGNEDTTYCAVGAAMAANIPTARHVILPGGHNVHLESPDAFVAQLAAFLDANAAQALGGGV
jgi:2-succinyl-6-hydroxy-2,4-cyclohexadiene-1-carboxylate synthase